MHSLSLLSSLPEWVKSFVEERKLQNFSTKQARMQLAIDLSCKNIIEKTGGPFGAVIFFQENGKYNLYAVGVERTKILNDPTAHGEMMAIRYGCCKNSHRNFEKSGLKDMELVTSAEMCGMCLNGIKLAGIKSILIGAIDEDLIRYDYDIGLKPTDWQKKLLMTGIHIEVGILRDEAVAILKKYREEQESK